MGHARSGSSQYSFWIFHSRRRAWPQLEIPLSKYRPKNVGPQRGDDGSIFLEYGTNYSYRSTSCSVTRGDNGGLSDSSTSTRTRMSIVICTMQAGVGANHSLRLVVSGKHSNVPTKRISYAAPVLQDFTGPGSFDAERLREIRLSKYLAEDLELKKKGCQYRLRILQGQSRRRNF